MQTTGAVDAMRAQVADWRRDGRVAFVPTMGNLHAGHLTLIRVARRHADHVVSSIFVNPLQFGEGEDFDSYPRTLDRDSELLAAEGTDLLFAPPVGVMYPRPQAEQTRVEVPGLSSQLCGATRPGHFVGVATVVCKLLNMVQADLALFGKKDFQQLMVIRRMVEDLCLPVEIVGVDTVREDDGLAMSSRNGYLTPDERETAPNLFRALQGTADALAGGSDDFADLEAVTAQQIDAAGLRTDYLSIRAAADLAIPQPGERRLVILAAAYLGKARLIDNLEVER